MGKKLLAVATTALLLVGACVSRSTTFVEAGQGAPSTAGSVAHVAVTTLTPPATSNVSAGGKGSDRAGANEDPSPGGSATNPVERGNPAASEPTRPERAASAAKQLKRPRGRPETEPLPTTLATAPGASQPATTADTPPPNPIGGPPIKSAAPTASAPASSASAMPNHADPPTAISSGPAVATPIPTVPSASATPSKPPSAGSPASAASAAASAASLCSSQCKDCCNRNDLLFTLERVFTFRSSGDSVLFGFWFLIVVTLVIGTVVVLPAWKLLKQKPDSADKADAKGLRLHLTIIGCAILVLIFLLFALRGDPPVQTAAGVTTPVIVTVQPTQAASGVQGVGAGVEFALLRLSTDMAELRRQVASESHRPWAPSVGALALGGFFASGILAVALAGGLLGMHYATRRKRAQPEVIRLDPISAEEEKLVVVAQLELDRLLGLVEHGAQGEAAADAKVEIEKVTNALSSLVGFRPKQDDTSKSTQGEPSASPPATFDWLGTQSDVSHRSVMELRSQLLRALRQVNAAIDALVARSAQAPSQLLEAMRELRRVTSQLQPLTPSANASAQGTETLS
jgi:hypothetical protein